MSATSIELAEEHGRRHSSVLRHIRDHLRDIRDSNISDDVELLSCEIIGANGKQRPYYRLGCKSEAYFRNRLDGMARVPIGAREEACLKTIEYILGINLIRQFSVLSYRIDGYHKESNTAYEIDEHPHKHKTIDDLDRQRIIKKHINCNFVRIPI